MTDDADRPPSDPIQLSDSDISDLTGLRDRGVASVYTIRRTKRARFRRLGLIGFSAQLFITKDGILALRKVGRA